MAHCPEELHEQLVLIQHDEVLGDIPEYLHQFGLTADFCLDFIFFSDSPYAAIFALEKNLISPRDLFEAIVSSEMEIPVLKSCIATLKSSVKASPKTPFRIVYM